jgi:hypothetical protein
MILVPNADVTGTDATLAITTHNAWYVNEGNIGNHNYEIQVYINQKSKANFLFSQAAYLPLTNENSFTLFEAPTINEATTNDNVTTTYTPWNSIVRN